MINGVMNWMKYLKVSFNHPKEFGTQFEYPTILIPKFNGLIFNTGDEQILLQWKN